MTILSTSPLVLTNGMKCFDAFVDSNLRFEVGITRDYYDLWVLVWATHIIERQLTIDGK